MYRSRGTGEHATENDDIVGRLRARHARELLPHWKGEVVSLEFEAIACSGVRFVPIRDKAAARRAERRRADRWGVALQFVRVGDAYSLLTTVKGGSPHASIGDMQTDAGLGRGRHAILGPHPSAGASLGKVRARFIWVRVRVPSVRRRIQKYGMETGVHVPSQAGVPLSKFEAVAWGERRAPACGCRLPRTPPVARSRSWAPCAACPE